MAKPIMIQGTMSNAGKSLLAAALCRIFRQDGYRCAPFKSQNMALNSFITREGLEMGRAQVMQAEAAGIEPSVMMNPILLKPTTDVGSQVIVNGEVRGNMTATEYFRRRKDFIPEIMAAYRALDSQYDIIVIEGAGSPVELNLLQDDIVNMGMARLVHSPVLLVGDIDRGGVFAQLLGTLSLFEPDDLARVKGLIVNKFRGDRSLFHDGVKILEQRGSKPVVGVVPYIKCDIEDEDSLSERFSRTERKAVDIAVIKLPHIANFTDFDVFSQYENVSVRYVTKPEHLAFCDMIIIPGSKSTMADLQWLRDSGWEAAVLRQAAEDVPILGICGGYQMLGQRIADPYATEGGGEIQGMGLLNTDTVFGQAKTRTRIGGVIAPCGGMFAELSGCECEGYEIHMGETTVRESPLVQLSDGRADGACRGNVYGSYLHGLFDRKEISDGIVRALCERKGEPFQERPMSRIAYKESQYDLLADAVRRNMDIDLLYRIVQNG